MTTDLSMKYDSLKLDVLAKIDKVSKLGINVDSYKEDILEVERRVNKRVNEELVAACATASYDSFYAEGLTNLSNVMKKLDKYERYVIIFNSCNWVAEVTKKDITIDELKECVSEMIYNIKTLLGSETVKFEHEAMIVNRVYEEAYKIMKLEILMTGASNLYKSAAKNEINYPYFSKLILKDIDSLSEKDREELSVKIYEIEKKGMNTNYFDLDLISRIVYILNREKLEETVVAKIKSIKEQVENNNKSISGSIASLDEAVSTLNVLKKGKRKNYRYITTNAISLLLSSILVSLGGAAVQEISSKLAEKPIYESGIEIYSTLNNDTNKTVTIESGGEVPKDSVIIKKYVNGQRSYLEYDVSKNEVQFDTAREYYEYGLDNYDVNPTFNDNDLVDFTLPECVEVIKKHYNQVSTTRDDGMYILSLGSLTILYIALIVLLVNKTMDTKIGILSSAAEHLIDNIVELNDSKKGIEENINYLQTNVDKCLMNIRENEVLREKYNELFQANLYLLGNYPELSKRLEDAVYDIEKIKKYKRKK